MRQRVALLFLALCSTACVAQARPAVIDLSCDQLIPEPERDSVRVERRPGGSGAADSAPLQGTLVVIPLAYRPTEPLAAPLRLRLFAPDGSRRFQSAWEPGPFIVTDTAGPASLEVACLGCTNRRIPLDIAAERTDTVRLFLTRMRNTCEIRATQAGAAQSAARPHNGSW